MASFAKTIIVGHLGRDPESRFLPNGDPVCNFSVAVTETWRDKSTGDKKESTTWYRVNAFGKLAEICGQYLKQGSSVLIEGKMQCRPYEKDGAKRESWELKAETMQMLGGKPQGEQAAQAPQRNAQGAPKPISDMDDEIPFLAHGSGKAWRVI